MLSCGVLAAHDSPPSVDRVPQFGGYIMTYAASLSFYLEGYFAPASVLPLGPPLGELSKKLPLCFRIRGWLL